MGLKTKQFLFALAAIFISAGVNAQCAMCRAALANSDGNIKAQAVNDGIVYLMIFPYLLVGLVGYAIYRMRKKMKDKKTEV